MTSSGILLYPYQCLTQLNISEASSCSRWKIMQRPTTGQCAEAERPGISLSNPFLRTQGSMQREDEELEVMDDSNSIVSSR